MTTTTEIPPVEADIRDVIGHFHNTLIGVARRIVGDGESAQDIVQDTYVTVLRDENAFRGFSSVKTYLYRIVINKSIDEIRKRKRRMHITDSLTREPSARQPGLDDSIDRKLIVDRILSKLPANLRIPLVLVDIDGMSYEEIAETLHLSIPCVRIRIFRAREKMRKELSALGWLP